MSGGGFSTAVVRPTTQAEILLAVVAKIQANVSAFESEPTCFVSATTFPEVSVQDNLFCTVMPGDGQFDQGIVDGSGSTGVCEIFPLIVTIWSHIEVDQIERYQQGLVDDERGLLTLKQQILQALAGRNVDGGTYNGAPSILLTEALMPTRSKVQMEQVTDEYYGGISVSFDAKFNWNLGGIDGGLS